MNDLWLWPAGLAVLVSIGAWLDVRHRRLPNWLALLLLVYSLVHWLFVGDLYVALSGFGHSLLALIVGMVLFRFGLIGGGDAKFYAGAAAYFSLSQGLILLLSVSLAGLVLVIIWISLRRITGKKISRQGDDRGKFPYGVAIALGVIAVLFSSLYSDAAMNTIS